MASRSSLWMGQACARHFEDPDVAGARDTQYFEMLGSRSIYHQGWKATTNHVYAQDSLAEGSRSLDTDRWSLSHIDRDFSEAHDVADEEPERVRQLSDLWWHEAGRNQVLPLLDSFVRPESESHAHYPAVNPPRDRYICFPGSGPVETPHPFATDFTFTVQLEIGRDTGLSGLVCAHHLRMSGLWSLRPVWACYILQRRPVVSFDLNGALQTVRVNEGLPIGVVELRIDYLTGSRGRSQVSLGIDGTRVGSTSFGPTGNFSTTAFNGMLLIGRGRGRSLCSDYALPFDFTTHIHRAAFERITIK